MKQIPEGILILDCKIVVVWDVIRVTWLLKYYQGRWLSAFSADNVTHNYVSARDVNAVG